MSPQFLPPCPSKLADENPLSPSAFPSALVFEISGQLVWTPFESSSIPSILPHKYHLPVPSSPLHPRCPPILSCPFAHIFLVRIHLQRHHDRRNATYPEFVDDKAIIQRRIQPRLCLQSLLDFSSHFEVQFASSGDSKYVLLLPHFPFLVRAQIHPAHSRSTEFRQPFDHLVLGSCTQNATTWPQNRTQ